MNADTWHGSLMIGLIVCLTAGALPACAQTPSSATDREVTLRFQAEMQRLKAFGPQATEYGKELQKQYDAYMRNATARAAVVRETQERIVQAREAFDRYYQQLVAEGDVEGAERMKKLFEISLLGIPVANLASPAGSATSAGPSR